MEADTGGYALARRTVVLGLAEAVEDNFVQNGQKIMFLCFAYLFVTDDVIELP